MEYRITHRTIYDYSEPVTVSHHAARLQPRTTDTQQPRNFALNIAPVPALRRQRVDYLGNQVCSFSIQENHRRFEVTATSIVAVANERPQSLALTPAWESVVERFRDPVSPNDVAAYEFCLNSPLLYAAPEFADYARASFTHGTQLLAGARELMRRLHTDFIYDPRATTVATPLTEVWEKRRGVCQDFAHLGIACLRSLGLPARYVSGYLRTIPPQGAERLIGSDASHAWFSVFCPQTGWVDFDPTNNILPANEHITVALGRDFSDVSPLSGVLTGGGEHTVDVAVDVEPLS